MLDSFNCDAREGSRAWKLWAGVSWGPSLGSVLLPGAQPGFPISLLTFQESLREAACIKWESLMWVLLCILFEQVSSHLKSSGSLFKWLCSLHMWNSKCLPGRCVLRNNLEKGQCKINDCKKFGFKLFHQNCLASDFVLAVLLWSTAGVTP